MCVDVDRRRIDSSSIPSVLFHAHGLKSASSASAAPPSASNPVPRGCIGANSRGASASALCRFFLKTVLLLRRPVVGGMSIRHKSV
jgi:hypothetical protein